MIVGMIAIIVDSAEIHGGGRSTGGCFPLCTAFPKPLAVGNIRFPCWLFAKGRWRGAPVGRTSQAKPGTRMTKTETVSPRETRGETRNLHSPTECDEDTNCTLRFAPHATRGEECDEP